MSAAAANIRDVVCIGTNEQIRQLVTMLAADVAALNMSGATFIILSKPLDPANADALAAALAKLKART